MGPSRQRTDYGATPSESRNEYPNSGATDPSQPIEEAELIARIGGEVVLAGEVLPQINQRINANREKIPDSMIPGLKREAMRNYVNQMIDMKLLYSEFRRNIPKENLPQLEQNIAEQFEKRQLPRLMEEMKVETRAELEAKLRETGTSIKDQQRAFGEQAVAMQWLRSQLNPDAVITKKEMLDYYHEHIEDYTFKSKVLWEEILIPFDRFPTKEDAYRRAAEVGNLVFLGKSDFATVAKTHSHGFTAAEGGRQDWTSQGSLVSETLDRALFTLPVGARALSPILESDRGFHIVRVIERKPAGRTSFKEAQVEIRKRLLEEDLEKQRKEYLAKLRRDARVWTIFDKDSETQVGRRNDPGAAAR